MIHPKLKLKAFLAVFREWFDGWLETKPPKELLQIAHSQLGKLYNKVDRELKAR